MAALNAAGRDSLIRNESDNSINYNTKMKCFLCEEDYPVYKLKMIARENEYVCKKCVKVSRSSGSRFDVTIRDMLRHVVAPVKPTAERFSIELQAEAPLAAAKTRAPIRTAPVASAQQFAAHRKRNRKCRRRANDGDANAFQLCRMSDSEAASEEILTVAATRSKTVPGSESVGASNGSSIENDKAVIYSVQTLPKPPTTAIVLADAGSSATGSGTSIIVDMNDALKSICEALGLLKVDTAAAAAAAATAADLHGAGSEPGVASAERSTATAVQSSSPAPPRTEALEGERATDDDNDGQEGVAKLFEPDEDTNVDEQMANYFKLDDEAEFCSIDHFLNTDEVQQHLLNDASFADIVSRNDQNLTGSSFAPADHRRTAKQRK